ncbi:cytochrome c oxidase assembly protein COX15-like protein isoform X1 [Huso huso]|uniref:Cytochrome c oxidase assembly protein COX15-like protein isoform X1 n=1 Tax=Huso huso TaxID=61971 RepID=A0ABR0ZCF5_HUSHU
MICLSSGRYLFSRRIPLPTRTRIALTSLLAMAYMQAGLDIRTLLLYVPTPLAATHQSGSLALLSLAIWLLADRPCCWTTCSLSLQERGPIDPAAGPPAPFLFFRERSDIDPAAGPPAPFLFFREVR